MSRRYMLHRSLDYHRVEWDRANGRADSLEVALAECWERENVPQPGLNQGCGILQNLMYDRDGGPRESITVRDAAVVATVVQWLGTNVGFAFLNGALQQAGYRVLYPREAQRREQERKAEQFLLAQGWTWV